LSNLVDIEPEGENETKKMSITLEKSMTFNVNVHTGTTQAVQAVKEAVKELKELKDHFETTLKYNVETILEDSEEFPVHMRAKKNTKVEVKKEVGKDYDKVSLEEYDEMRKVREWDTLMCLATRLPQEEKPDEVDTRREEKIGDRMEQCINKK
jgi:acetylornithine deacetylase/succinyl-diaminopimelate desuccinylase-like protein